VIKGRAKSLEPQLALSVARHFRLTNSEAQEILENLRDAISDWPEVAVEYKLSLREQE
jgi:serine/threonine-protein kinase HipA